MKSTGASIVSKGFQSQDQKKTWSNQNKKPFLPPDRYDWLYFNKENKPCHHFVLILAVCSPSFLLTFSSTDRERERGSFLYIFLFKRSLACRPLGLGFHSFPVGTFFSVCTFHPCRFIIDLIFLKKNLTQIKLGYFQRKFLSRSTAPR